MLFRSIDDNFRPKKFRLKSESGAISDSFIASQIKFALGESQIYVQNEKYHLIEYGLEEEYEQEIAANYKLIFGENSVYFDLKKKLGNRICDGFVYDKELRRLVIVENELFTHDLWGHIIPQIIDFFNNIKHTDVQMKLKYEIDWGLDEKDKLTIIEAVDKSNFDIVIVIDRITFDISQQKKAISELISHFDGSKNVRIYFKEFKVFTNSKNKKIFMTS